MLAKAGIQGFSIWIPAGVYPGENRGKNDGQMRIEAEVDLFLEPNAFQARKDSA